MFCCTSHIGQAALMNLSSSLGTASYLLTLHLANYSPPRTAAATMPPQIKQDLNRSGWETTDFPSVCENCLPENPYVQMLKEDYGAECKIVSFFPLLSSQITSN